MRLAFQHSANYILCASMIIMGAILFTNLHFVKSRTFKDAFNLFNLPLIILTFGLWTHLIQFLTQIWPYLWFSRIKDSLRSSFSYILDNARKLGSHATETFVKLKFLRLHAKIQREDFSWCSEKKIGRELGHVGRGAYFAYIIKACPAWDAPVKTCCTIHGFLHTRLQCVFWGLKWGLIELKVR